MVQKLAKTGCLCLSPPFQVWPGSAFAVPERHAAPGGTPSGPQWSEKQVWMCSQS